MDGTLDTVRAFVKANPGADVTEDRFRWALRRGLIPPVRRVAGRLVWSRADVLALAAALDLVPPEVDDEPGRAAVA